MLGYQTIYEKSLNGIKTLSDGISTMQNGIMNVNEINASGGNLQGVDMTGGDIHCTSLNLNNAVYTDEFLALDGINTTETIQDQFDGIHFAIDDISNTYLSIVDAELNYGRLHHDNYWTATNYNNRHIILTTDLSEGVNTRIVFRNATQTMDRIIMDMNGMNCYDDFGTVRNRISIAGSMSSGQFDVLDGSGNAVFVYNATTLDAYLAIVDAIASYGRLNYNSNWASLNTFFNGVTIDNNSQILFPDNVGLNRLYIDISGILHVDDSAVLKNSISIDGMASCQYDVLDDFGDVIFTYDESTLNSYLTLSSASSTYLSIANAVTTYLSISNAISNYLSISNAVSTYLSISNAVTNYLSISTASSTYLTIANAVSNYLSISTASSTYAKVATNNTFAGSTNTFSNTVAINNLDVNTIVSTSSGKISMNCDCAIPITNNLIRRELTAGYLINGTSPNTMYPFICSITNIANDCDDSFIINGGYTIGLYSGTSYTAYLGTLDNSTGIQPLRTTSSSIYGSNNSVSSIKVYYLGTEITLSGIS